MKRSLLLAAASLAVISCSKREMGVWDKPDTPKEVSFASYYDAVAHSKVTVDDEGHSTFEEGDLIGVYAVLHGKKLGIDNTEAFPASQKMQYLDKSFTVESVAPYQPAGPSMIPSKGATPATATFKPTAEGVDNMYYMPGGQGWNYYAYYPTSQSGSPLFTQMPKTVTGGVAAANFKKEDTRNNFYDQSLLASGGLTSNAFPGPIMFAYYGTEDKAKPAGQEQPAVNLPFKYAVAKLSLEVTMDQAIGMNTDVSAVTFYANGLKKGIVFDLTKATEVGTSGVYEVITQKEEGEAMDGTTTTPVAQAPTAATTKAYFLGAKADNLNAQKFTVTGYLIPAGNNTSGGTLTGAKIDFYVGRTNPMKYTAVLDRSSVAQVGDGPQQKNYLPEIAPGKEYKFKIKISAQEVTFTGTIEDWEVVNGNEEIPAE